MATVLEKAGKRPLAEPQHLLLSCVSWPAFEKILDALGRHHLRMTYDRGALEFMSPVCVHERWKIMFSRLFVMLSVELHVSMKAFGSTTLCREDVQQAPGPDECFYLASTARLRAPCDLDLKLGPPPDLAFEIENGITRLDRLAVYAGLGVPEVWTFDGARVQAHRLISGAKYDLVPASLQLPFVPLAEVGPLLDEAVDTPHDGVALELISAWVRQRVAPLYQAAGGKFPPVA